MLHRDLKPGAVLWHEERRKIADFGIAKFVGDATSLERHRTSLTPVYAAPEQWRGERTKNAADVHALGCIIHALFDRQAALSWGCRCCPRGAFAQAGAGSADRRQPARRVYRDHVAKITDLAPTAKSLRRSDRSRSSAAQFGSAVNYAYASLRSQIHMETASEATTRAGGSCTTTGTTRRRSPST
ncbi:MAG: protein kinase [Phenylobacterium sp.]|nr:protein kinase [Phenylobacterium sp.]